MIRIRDLRFRWPRAAADTLAIDTLDIAAGEALFLDGPSGCGKSTLLGLLAGVLLPTAGTVAVQGRDWQALPGAKRDAARADHVGYLFQQFNLLGYLSVLDNVRLPCRFSKARAARAGTGAAEGGLGPATPLHCRSASSNAWPRRGRRSARRNS